MDRDLAFKILTKYVKNPNLIKHCLATEAVMKALYKKFYQGPNYTAENEAEWGITGLLHDGDYELCKGRPEIHGTLLIDKEGDKIPKEIAYAIKAHNFERTLVLPKTLLDWSIAICDQLTGIIVAAALVHPDKKLSSLTPDFVLKKFNTNSFAKGADRRMVLRCEDKLKIPLKEFMEINLTAMQGIAKDLGL